MIPDCTQCGCERLDELRNAAWHCGHSWLVTHVLPQPRRVSDMVRVQVGMHRRLRQPRGEARAPPCGAVEGSCFYGCALV